MAVHDTIIKGLIRELRNIVGDRLANLPVNPADNTPIKAVIRDRVKGIRPSYPFITVDLSSSENTYSFLKNEFFDETNRKQVFVKEHRIPLTITCYGKDSIDILNDIRIQIEDSITRNSINTATSAVFNYFTDAVEIPSFMTTDFVEAATMDAIFLAETRWSPEGASNIERVNGTGELFQQSDRTDTPTQITFNNL